MLLFDDLALIKLDSMYWRIAASLVSIACIDIILQPWLVFTILDQVVFSAFSDFAALFKALMPALPKLYPFVLI